MSDALRFSPRIYCLPIVHGSGDCALEVRRVLLAEKFDCVAVPLPPSFQRDVLHAIDFLPTPTLVAQREAAEYELDWSPDRDQADDDDREDSEAPTLSYVPIDPCQPVIMALRVALAERPESSRKRQFGKSRNAVRQKPILA